MGAATDPMVKAVQNGRQLALKVRARSDSILCVRYVPWLSAPAPGLYLRVICWILCARKCVVWVRNTVQNLRRYYAPQCQPHTTTIPDRNAVG
jgi:hypothetical protein